jgi:hypothetical protein
MATTGCEEQEPALAVSVNGEVTSLPFSGVLIVTDAHAGTARVKSTNTAGKLIFI